MQPESVVRVYPVGSVQGALVFSPSKELNASALSTREQWLTRAIEKLKPLFKAVGHDIPQVRVSVGFPGGGSARKRIGEYWSASASEDKVPQIFISPVLGTAFEHLDTLCHELVHACTPGAGHKKPFKQLATALGMVGPMRAAGAGPELKLKLEAMALELGDLPHSRLNLSDRKKQTTRLVKCECEECGYTVRTTGKWLETYGAPICPCGDQLCMRVMS